MDDNKLIVAVFVVIAAVMIAAMASDVVMQRYDRRIDECRGRLTLARSHADSTAVVDRTPFCARVLARRADGS